MSSRRQRRLEAKEFAKKSGGKFSVSASTKKLSEIKNEIPFYSLVEMAKYADGVVKETYNDFLLHAPAIDWIESKVDGDLYIECNSTAFGNAAFLALNSDYDRIKDGSMGFIKRMREYVSFLGKAPKLNEDGFYYP